MTQLASKRLVTEQSLASGPAGSIVSGKYGRRRMYDASDYTGGDDMGAAINRAIAAAAADGYGFGKPGQVVLPPMNAAIVTPIVPMDGVDVFGSGHGGTVLRPQSDQPCINLTRTSTTPLTNVTFADFEIDGSQQALVTGYLTRIKGFYLRYTRRVLIDHVYVHDTGASGIGNDYHDDCVIRDSLVTGCGRLNDGTGGGGAGIGIGTGAWVTEGLVIEGCTTRGNVRDGVFFETQTGGLPLGTRIIGHLSESNGKHGIADAGLSGLVIQGGMSRANGLSGFASYQGTINPGIPGSYGTIENMDFQSNGDNGVHIDWSGRVGTQCRYVIRGNRTRSNTNHGIYVQIGAADLPVLGITDNEINSNQRAGIYVGTAGGALIDATIADNRIYSNGLNTGAAERQGIRINANTTRLKVAGNRAWDSQATPTQTHGLQLSGTFTHTQPYFDGNDFRTNGTGAVNNAATITSSGVIGPNNAGWTVAAGTPEAVVAAPVGTVYRRTDGGAGTTFYVKETGSANTGWVAK